MTDIFDELQWRGLVAQTTDLQALRTALADGPLTMYVGFDPSADSLHIGHLVQLIVARKMQQAGHRVLCLVGGSTGLIGDPKPDAERVLRDKAQVAQAVEGIKRQVQAIVRFDGDNPADMVNNLDWTEGISALDFLRDYGRYFRVNAMIKKDAVARRLNSDLGISYTEFSYQILQALDYLQLFRERHCTLQLGGSDQWGNLIAGVDLIRSAEGAPVHAMTTPLVTDATGRKYGKSEGNALWLNPDLMSPYAFYQFWVNMDDAEVVDKLRIFTDLGQERIAELAQEVRDAPFRRTAQKTLAQSVTTLVHGADATHAVQAASDALFGKGDMHRLDRRTLIDATAELPGGTVPVGAGVVDALLAVGIADSRNAARRLIGEGGVSLNNARVGSEEQTVHEGDFLHGEVAILKRGRKHLAAARRAPGGR